MIEHLKKSKAYQGLVEHLTLILSLLTLLLAIGWLIKEQDFEPLITSLAIGAAIYGYFVDPKLEEKKSRESVINAACSEITLNLNVMTGDGFARLAVWDGAKIYPKMVTVSMERALASGLFHDRIQLETLDAFANAIVFAHMLNDYLNTVTIVQPFWNADFALQKHNEITETEVYQVAKKRFIELAMKIKPSIIENALRDYERLTIKARTAPESSEGKSP